MKIINEIIHKINVIKMDVELKINKIDKDLISDVKNKKLTYLSERKLKGIISTCKRIEKEKILGSFIEAGCALGGSSIIIAKTKLENRKFYIYDVFGMIPPPSINDPQEVHDRYKIIVSGESEGISGDRYYGYEKDLSEIVKNNFAKFNIDISKNSILLIKGLIQDTLIDYDVPVAFAHIDVDWYEPVKVSIERIFPNLSLGGCIVFDDYYDWGGCKKAVDEYFEKYDKKIKLDDSFGNLIITRIG